METGLAMHMLYFPPLKFSSWLDALFLQCHYAIMQNYFNIRMLELVCLILATECSYIIIGHVFLFFFSFYFWLLQLFPDVFFLKSTVKPLIKKIQ